MGARLARQRERHASLDARREFHLSRGPGAAWRERRPLYVPAGRLPVAPRPELADARGRHRLEILKPFERKGRRSIVPAGRRASTPVSRSVTTIWAAMTVTTVRGRPANHISG